jgi:hypothetical protein
MVLGGGFTVFGDSWRFMVLLMGFYGCIVGFSRVSIQQSH